MLNPEAPKSPETSIRRCLPFLQLDPASATLDDFLSVGKGCLLSVLFASPKEQKESHFKKCVKGYESKALEHLRETLVGIQKMIYIATVNHHTPENELQTLSKSFIEPALKNCSFWINWVKPGVANITPFKDSSQRHEMWQETLMSFRRRLIWCVAETFHSYEGKPVFDTLCFSACPTCRRVFEKKRKDQRFCSLPCGNLARVRKRRAKAKDA